MNVLILEDEALVGENLVQQVKKLEPDWEIAGPLPSLREARAWLQQHPAPDLILADIQLSDGISLDLFYLSQPACPIIFTTTCFKLTPKFSIRSDNFRFREYRYCFNHSR